MVWSDIKINLYACFGRAAISESEIDDVREVLDFYREFEDPVAKFGQLKRELEEEDLRREEERKNNTAPVAKNWTPSLLSKWF